MIGAGKCNDTVRLVSDDPAVVGIGGIETAHPHGAEKHARRRRRQSRYQREPVQRARRAGLAPSAGPTALTTPPALGGPANREPADMHDLETALHHLSHFVGRVEPLENHSIMAIRDGTCAEKLHQRSSEHERLFNGYLTKLTFSLPSGRRLRAGTAIVRTVRRAPSHSPFSAGESPKQSAA